MGIKTVIFTLLFIFNLHASERIISLSPSITEIVFALDKGDLLVGTSAYSLYPEEAKKIPVVGGYESPCFERILALRPTLVIAQTYNKSILEKLHQFNIETLIVDLKKVDSIKESIKTIATRLRSNKANQLTSAIDQAFVKTKTTNKPHSVMIVYGLKEDLRSNTYIAGHNIFFEDIIHSCGHTNAYTELSNTQPVLSYENIIAINPDQIIILHSLATQGNVDVDKALKKWYRIPIKASQNKKISIINEGYLHIPSHRVALTIEKLCGVMND